MGTFADEKAVRLTQQLFDEAGIVTDFNTAGRGDIPVHEDVATQSTNARHVPDRRRIVSRYLKDLTFHQVQTLTTSVTVTVVPRHTTTRKRSLQSSQAVENKVNKNVKMKKSKKKLKIKLKK